MRARLYHHKLHYLLQ